MRKLVRIKAYTKRNPDIISDANTLITIYDKEDPQNPDKVQKLDPYMTKGSSHDSSSLDRGEEIGSCFYVEQGSKIDYEIRKPGYYIIYGDGIVLSDDTNEQIIEEDLVRKDYSYYIYPEFFKNLQTISASTVNNLIQALFNWNESFRNHYHNGSYLDPMLIADDSLDAAGTKGIEVKSIQKELFDFVWRENKSYLPNLNHSGYGSGLKIETRQSDTANIEKDMMFYERYNVLPPGSIVMLDNTSDYTNTTLLNYGWVPCDGTTYYAVLSPQERAPILSNGKIWSTTKPNPYNEYVVVHKTVDMRDRAPLGRGTVDYTSWVDNVRQVVSKEYEFNEIGGGYTVTLIPNQIPTHNHGYIDRSGDAKRQEAGQYDLGVIMTVIEAFAFAAFIALIANPLTVAVGLVAAGRMIDRLNAAYTDVREPTNDYSSYTYSFGGSQAHNNMPPYRILKYIEKLPYLEVK
jgi:microcystin-dependent protein